MKDMIRILTILDKYNGELCAEHDIIYFGVHPDEVSSEDMEALEDLGCHVDSGANCLAKFV